MIRLLVTLSAFMLGLSPVLVLVTGMIDVRLWQSGINVTSTGVQIVIAKATEGTGYA